MTVSINLPDEEICDLYKNRVSIDKLAVKYNVSCWTIKNRLDKYNIPIFKLGTLTRKCPNVNENYFDNVDTEEKAYFLGLIYADGCNLDVAKRMTIDLQEGDKEILEKMSIAINNKIDLYFKPSRSNNKDQYGLSINSTHMSNKLTELGCTPRKSLTLEFPKWLIDPELQRHFIRGYFDGDGSLFSYQRKSRIKKDYRASIVSTNKFCSIVKDIIEKTLHIHVMEKLVNANKNSITTVISVKGNRQVINVLSHKL